MIKILDCTLRDGGYINNWSFGNENIKYICYKLAQANIDFIEVGYLNSNATDDENKTKINKINIEKSDIITPKLMMINYGDYNVDELPEYNEQIDIQGIRLAFHKKNMNEALAECKKIKKKGYKLFIQPMLSISYNKNEFSTLIEYVNEIEPYAFYIVDSFGSMEYKEIEKYTNIIKENLKRNISVGFHSHNNLQMAVSNTDYFISLLSNDFNIIIDSSVYGMGRGAGNLPTELCIQHIVNQKKYDIEPILDIIEKVLMAIKQEYPWGYAIEYYISARHKCHPNYAKYLVDKKTININDIEKIIKMIPEEKKISYDENYIENLYEQSLEKEYDDCKSYGILEEILNNKEILLIGPGRSINKEKESIKDVQENDKLITILINHYTKDIKANYVFFSNNNRYELYKKCIQDKNLIITSNINTENSKVIIFDYKKSIIDRGKPTDNSLLMFLNIIKKLNIKQIYLAGFDGFGVDLELNHYDNKLYNSIEKNKVNELNSSMKENLNYFSNFLKIKFITNSKYMEE